MTVVKTDQRRRVTLPDAGSGWVFHVTRPTPKSYLLTFIEEPEQADIVPSIFEGLRRPTKAEIALAFGPNAEFDALEAAMAKHPYIPEEPE
ncbi:MAG: hypothetical protein ABSC03_01570 [Verrucomicrobiota bacterium]|jgi:hypothetical protein